MAIIKSEMCNAMNDPNSNGTRAIRNISKDAIENVTWRFSFHYLGFDLKSKIDESTGGTDFQHIFFGLLKYISFFEMLFEN